MKDLKNYLLNIGITESTPEAKHEPPTVFYYDRDSVLICFDYGMIAPPEVFKELRRQEDSARDYITRHGYTFYSELYGDTRYITVQEATA